MKAMILDAPGGLDRLRLVDRPDPGAPGPGMIRVRLHATSLNYHDYGIVSGNMPTEDGRIPMADGAGLVEAIGDGVTELAVGDAIGLAVKRLRTQTEGQRVLVLLTDGVNTAGALQPAKAAELARDAGVRVHTIAFGGEGVLSLFGFQLPMPGGGDEIDEKGLAAIASTTGGQFFRARDTAELAGIYAEIDRIEPITRAGEAVRPRLERYPWPLGAAWLLAIVAFLRPQRRRA